MVRRAALVAAILLLALPAFAECTHVLTSQSAAIHLYNESGTAVGDSVQINYVEIMGTGSDARWKIEGYDGSSWATTYPSNGDTAAYYFDGIPVALDNRQGFRSPYTRHRVVITPSGTFTALQVEFR